MKDFMSIPGFYRQFPTEEICASFIERERWGGKPFCPRCGEIKVYRVKGVMGFKCSGCRKRFSVRTGSVMEASKVSLQTWLLAIYMMTTARKGISSVQFAKELGVTQKTAWFLANRIREACSKGEALLTGEVEVDEAYIGGKEKNKHANKRLRAGRGAIGKQAVLGMRERSGPVRAMPVDGNDQVTLHPIIRDNVKTGSTLYTDEHKAYGGMPEYNRKAVRHNFDEAVKAVVRDKTSRGQADKLKEGQPDSRKPRAIIHRGDCLEIMASIPDESVRAVVTSPPYNLKNSTGNGLKNGPTRAGGAMAKRPWTPSLTPPISRGRN